MRCELVLPMSSLEFYGKTRGEVRDGAGIAMTTEAIGTRNTDASRMPRSKVAFQGCL